MSKGTLQRIRRILLVSSAFVGLLSMSTYGVLENSYVNYSRVPEEALGRVVPHKVKGITVYITEKQSEMIHWVTSILIVSGSLVLIVLFLNLVWPIETNRSNSTSDP